MFGAGFTLLSDLSNLKGKSTPIFSAECLQILTRNHIKQKAFGNRTLTLTVNKEATPAGNLRVVGLKTVIQLHAL